MPNKTCDMAEGSKHRGKCNWDEVAQQRTGCA